MHLPEIGVCFRRDRIDDSDNADELSGADLHELLRCPSLTASLDPVIDQENKVAGGQSSALQTQYVAVPR